jgi:flagellin
VTEAGCKAAHAGKDSGGIWFPQEETKMAFSINTNITSLQAQYYLNKTQQFQSKTINEVTSGLRIVNSGDDAAGLAVANGYRSDEAVLNQGISNLNSATATLQTIDSGMADIGNLLDRARTLATQSASQTFTGDRNALNNEFQSVLTEIDRQSQAIGMNAGGTFNTSMQVFVGGGRASGATTAATNGSVTVDLTKSAVDTNSLGLAATGAEGSVDLRAGASNALSTAVGTANATASFTFSGVGYTGGQTVTVSNAALSKVKTTDDLASVINDAITTAGSLNSAFAGSNIKASVDGSGKLLFTGSTSFNVAANTSATDMGQALYGANAVDAGGSSAISGDTFTAMAATDKQTLTFNYRDSTGASQNVSVVLANGSAVADAKAAVTSINTQLNGTAGLYATVNNGKIDFMSKDNQDFSVTVGAGVIAASGNQSLVGVNAGTYSVAGSSTVAGSTSTDISTQGGAVSAVTALATAVANLGLAQGTVGKHENQLNYALSLASTQVTNLASSESQIRDADLAAQAANLSKAQILSQAGVAALAQANSAPQAILSLLKG